MAGYNKEFIEEFATKCRNLESFESRQSYMNSVLEFVNEVYEGTLSGDAPARYSEQMSSSLSISERLDKLSLVGTEVKESIDEVLRTIQRMVVETGCNPLTGSIFGFVGNTSNYISVLGASIASFIPVLATLHQFAPGSCELELRVVNWLCSLVGYGKGSCGYLSSGTSVANVQAFMMARDINLGTASLYDKSVVYMSELAHSSILKALRVVGLGSCNLRKIPVDADFRMNTTLLENAIKKDLKSDLKPFLVIGTAGTTDAGSIDPLADIARIGKQYNLWFHVDGAIGGVCLLSPRLEKKLEGGGHQRICLEPLRSDEHLSLVINHECPLHSGITYYTDWVKTLTYTMKLSDSISVDCHKLLSQPPGIGAILVKNGRQLKSGMAVDESAYLTTESDTYYSPKDHTFELSRPVRGMSIWFSLKILGEEFFRNLVEEKLSLVQYFLEELRTIPYTKLYNDPELLMILFRYEPPWETAVYDETSCNAKLEKLLEADDRIYFHGATIKGKRYLRVCICTFRTHLSEINCLLGCIREKIEIIKPH